MRLEQIVWSIVRLEQIVWSIGRTGRQLIRWWTPLRIAGAALLVLALLVGTLGYVNERELLHLTETAKQILKYLSANASTELASIAITILIVDALYQRRETEREKKRLILQMGSPDNAFAREAVRALWARGWLHDGSVNKAYLKLANLQGADLRDTSLQKVHLEAADLRKARLDSVELQEAIMVGANLQGTSLGRANLQGAILSHANLQGAFLWDANLQGVDLEDADLRGADLRNANLQGALLRRANLQGTDLMDTNLQEAWLKDALYNDATTWPEGFTPPAEAINAGTETDIED